MINEQKLVLVFLQKQLLIANNIARSNETFLGMDLYQQQEGTKYNLGNPAK